MCLEKSLNTVFWSENDHKSFSGFPNSASKIPVPIYQPRQRKAISRRKPIIHNSTKNSTYTQAILQVIFGQMGATEQIISILNNSKQINELPSLPEVAPGDLIGIWSFANNRTEWYPAEILVNRSFSFNVNTIALSLGTSVAIGKVDLQYNGTVVTRILFDSVFSQYLAGFDAVLGQFGFIIKLFNSSKLKTHIAKIETFAYTDGTQSHYLAFVGNTINVADLSTGDSLQVQISASISQAAPYILIEGNKFEYIPIFESNGSTFQAGDIAINGRIDASTYGKLLMYTSGDPTLFASWKIIEKL